jgi:hypothetical protein
MRLRLHHTRQGADRLVAARLLGSNDADELDTDFAGQEVEQNAAS